MLVWFRSSSQLSVRRAARAPVGGRRSRRRPDSSRTQHERLRRAGRAEEPRRPAWRPDRRRAPRPARRAQAVEPSRPRPRVRHERELTLHPQRDPRSSANRVATRGARADQPARVPPYLRESPDRGRRQRQGDHGLPRPCLDSDDVRPVRPPHAGQRGRGDRPRRRLSRRANTAGRVADIGGR